MKIQSRITISQLQNVHSNENRNRFAIAILKMSETAAFQLSYQRKCRFQITQRAQIKVPDIVLKQNREFREILGAYEI